MVQFLMLVGINLSIFLLLHFVVGKYPESLPLSTSKKGQVIEAVGIWALVTLAVTIAALLIPESELRNPSFGIVLRSNLILSPFWLFIPLAIVLFKDKWSITALGFTLSQSRPVTLFSIGVMLIIGALQYIDPAFTPLPGWLVIMSAYQPAFTEEFLFRGVIQGKLERALGQNKGWIFSGILFGLMHTSVNFFGQQWYRYGENYLNALLLLLVQIIAGWTFGIMYTKSRSLLPGAIAHFLADGRFASILYFTATLIP